MKLTKEQIKFLDKVCFGRDKWKLNSNGEVDVDGSVSMSSMNLTEIPVKFGRVDGEFHCYVNNLTSLEGCSTSIGGNFYCHYNQLTSLEGCSTSIGGNFYCHNNHLTSLEGYPTSVGGDFYCHDNHLTNYFKTIKEEDFPLWDKLYWGLILKDYPFLINIGKKYIKDLKGYLNTIPQTKIYLE